MLWFVHGSGAGNQRRTLSSSRSPATYPQLTHNTGIRDGEGTDDSSYLLTLLALAIGLEAYVIKKHSFANAIWTHRESLEFRLSMSSHLPDLFHVTHKCMQASDPHLPLLLPCF
jgi:hypothetical protein